MITGPFYLSEMLNYRSLKWIFETGDAIESSPTIDADGTIYIGSNDGKLYAIGEASSNN